MEALAAKPAKLSSEGAAGWAGQELTDTTPDVFSQSNTNVRATVYANSIGLGKTLAEMSGELMSIEAHNRVVEKIKVYAEQLIAVELRSQNNLSTKHVFEGVVPRPTNKRDGGHLPDAGESRGRGARG